MGDVLHVRGRVVLAPDDVRDELWVVDGRVTYTRPSRVDDVVEGWVLPGLVDAHCHVGLDAHGAVDEATTLAQALTDRDAGALLLRDAGSPADTRWVQQRDDLPRLVRAGRHVARTRRYIRNFAEEVEPEDLAATLAAQARRGDGWVKIVGDWIDRDTGDLAPCWPAWAVRDAIAAAHAEGARVTAHCFGEAVLTDLADAGIDCVEHATGLTDETIALFARHDVAIVPTLVNIATFPQIAAGAEAKFPRYAAHLRDLHARRQATVAEAVEAGVRVYCGTDAGGSLAHGLVADEIGELAVAGLGAAGALDAGCWSARAWLRRPGLEEGEGADLVVYDADPRSELRVLAHPAAVVLRGAVVAGGVRSTG